MKLFIAAALIAVAAAGRLEHLENSYLPPDHTHGQAGFGSQGFRSSSNGHGSFGANSGSFGANSGSFGGHFGSLGANSGSFGGHSGSLGANSGSFGGHSAGSFGSHSAGSFGGSGLDSNVIDSAAAGSFPGATSNQYLPPNYGTSGSNGQFSGSLNGFQRSQSVPQYTPQHSGSQYQANQYGSASNGLPQTRYQQGAGSSGINAQYPSASRQYLAPKSQNIPQQAFDEQTGYHY